MIRKTRSENIAGESFDEVSLEEKKIDSNDEVLLWTDIYIVI